MQRTPNYNLLQYQVGDKFLKEDLNDSFSKIDTAISDIQETVNNGGGATGDSVTGSTTNGNIVINGTETPVYIHPSTHSASIITQDANNRFVTDVEKTTWNGKQDALSGDIAGHYHSSDRSWANISGKPTFANVATSGSYSDLSNTPTIPDTTQLTNAVSKILTVAAVTNTYTLDLSTALNFVIETTDTNAKTITFSNVPAAVNTVTTVSIILKFTNSATFTYPTGAVWKDGTTPTYTAGKKYMLMFTTYDNGTSYLGSYVGAW